MPARTVGAAPLLSGIVLAGTAASNITTAGPTAWNVVALVGGCAAIAVGATILLGGEPATDGGPTARDERP